MEQRASENLSLFSQRTTLQRLYLQWLCAYRILFATSVTASVAVLLALRLSDRLSPEGASTAVAVHLFVTVAIRNDEVLNFGFGIVATISSRALPYTARKLIADAHHCGGLHSGCAVSAVAWYIVFLELYVMESTRTPDRDVIRDIDYISCWLFLCLIGLICSTSLPYLRNRFHNLFERTHRFAGWSSILVLWMNLIVRTRRREATHLHLLTTPSFWLLIATTFLLVLPWVRLYRVSVTSVRMSGREIRLTFTYATMPHCSTLRFSLAPLTEWHAFATVPSRDGITADIVISGLGDWTRQIVANPPQQFWVRGPPMLNFLAWAPMFDSVLFVGTGAGVGPLLSLFVSPKIASMKADGKRVRVMWVARDVDGECWGFVKAIIASVDAAAVIHDTRNGRPDIAVEARRLAEEEGLEAVMVVSNREVTDSVVWECKAARVAAYGSVFDS